MSCLYARLAATILLTCSFLPVSRAQAQPADVLVSGQVRSGQNAPVAQAVVQVASLGEVQLSDSLGAVQMRLPAHQTYMVTISCPGYKTLETSLTTDGDTMRPVWTLAGGQAQLQEINIIAAGASGKGTQPIKAQIIDATASKEQPSTLVELMNRAAGVRIRQTGGLGASSNLMLNGFQNRSVRYFKDGIPLDYLGAGFDISLVPVNMLDHVEVYKGVLPAELGADALGGAVNLVTRHSYKNFAGISYEAGSFNTHRVSLNAGIRSKNEKFFAGINAFYNYSDNDYKVDVKTTDPVTGTQQDETVKLFHNRFTNYYVEAYAGLSHLRWADELRISATQFSVFKEFPFGATMDIPFGAAKGLQRSFIPSLQYRKSLLHSRLDIHQFVAANRLHTQMTDTIHGHYDWLGNFTPNPSQIGELTGRGSLADVSFDYFASRTNIRYRLSSTQVLNFNAVFNNYTRKGTDPYGYKFRSGIDVLTVPAHYNKMILALGLRSDFAKGRLQNNLVGKFFRYSTDASDADYQGNEIGTRNRNAQWGIADGIKYTINERSFLTLSAETALRLPEQDELFGDGNLKLSNFNLKPERSLNITAGYKRTVAQQYELEINAFYRHTKDLILLMPINFMYAQSQNVDQVRGAGLDADGNYFILPWLNASANFTYQNLRLVHTGYAATEGARLKNTPYFFANAGIDARFNRLFGKKDKIAVYWFYSFVREYYLDYIPKSVEPDGFLGLSGRAGIDARNIIPNQSVHTLGFTYYPAGDAFAIGFQAKNIFNARVYDNFKIQNPGRSFFIKLSYSL